MSTRLLALAGLLASGITASGSSWADARILNPPSRPTVIEVGFYLSDINDINEQQETFEVEAQLISTWDDPRLAFDPETEGTHVKTYTGDYQFNEVFTGWWPQLILTNESGDFEQQGVVLRVSPQGRLQLIQEITARAEMPMALQRFPFDRQTFTANFVVLGYEEDQIVLSPDIDQTGRDDTGVQIAQWNLKSISVDVKPFQPSLEGNLKPTYSQFSVHLDMERQPQFMLRVVVFPLALLCLLCASVFWMDHESLGDRMAISFTGLLTVVAYQFLIGGSLPTIAYFTLMDGFVYSTYAFVAGTIMINLRVDHLNRTGRQEVGDRLDEKCRWIFPSIFMGTNLLIAFVFFIT
ncbi:MAG: hypothetical protein VX252_17625 [Myxococcota bacterium]|nr:hypothetical protein [Myxococcota bacterium]